MKELVNKWHQIVNNHLEFESNLSEAIIWLDNVDDKLTSCTEFNSTNKDDLEEKLIVIQVKLFILYLCFYYNFMDNNIALAVSTD